MNPLITRCFGFFLFSAHSSLSSQVRRSLSWQVTEKEGHQLSIYWFIAGRPGHHWNSYDRSSYEPSCWCPNFGAGYGYHGYNKGYGGYGRRSDGYFYRRYYSPQCCYYPPYTNTGFNYGSYENYGSYGSRPEIKDDLSSYGESKVESSKYWSEKLDQDVDLDAKEHDIDEHDAEEHDSEANTSEEHDSKVKDSEEHDSGELAHEQEDYDHDKNTESFSEALKEVDQIQSEHPDQGHKVELGEIEVESNNTFFVGVLLPRQQYSGSHPFEVMYHQCLHFSTHMIWPSQYLIKM